MTTDKDSSQNKIVPLKRDLARPTLSPGLEEVRRLLQEVEPAPDNGPMSDASVIEDGYVFRQRFGYGFNWSRRHREALIQLKHEKELTDAEIKLFRRTGNLLRTPLGIKLTADNWVAVWGILQLAIWIGALIALLVASLLDWETPSFRPYKAAALSGALLAFCYAIYWLHIKPWFIQRRVEQASKNRSA